MPTATLALTADRSPQSAIAMTNTALHAAHRRSHLASAIGEGFWLKWIAILAQHDPCDAGAHERGANGYARRASTIFRRDALTAGSTPPTIPMTNAKTSVCPMTSGVSTNENASSEKL